jgi:glycosyltransferase involved in cell wall biosynthesis
MEVFTLLPKEYHASYYYRIGVPLFTMQEMGLGVLPLVDDMTVEISNQSRLRCITSSDINLFYQPVGEHLVKNMNITKSWKALRNKHRNMEWQWPPLFVLDTDDDLFNVHPFNEAFRTMGTRDHEGNEIPIDPEHPWVLGTEINGQKVEMYRDGKDGFSLEANRATIARYKEIVENATAVTCSTLGTQAYIHRETSQRNTHVFPNSIRFDHYTKVDLAEHPNEVRILWQGSPTHYEDWYPLRYALSSVAKKYPHAKFIIFGEMYNWVMQFVPASQVEHIKWVPYGQYKLRLGTIGHDISLAPLKDTRFNLSRSAIKFYESSSIYRPAATLAQNTGVYAAEVIDNETGLLFNTPEEFEQKLCTLIEDATLRKNLASNARDWVVDNRDAFKTVPKLHEFYLKLKEEQKASSPHATPDEEAENERLMKEQEAAETAEAAAVAEATDALPVLAAAGDVETYPKA